MAGFKSRMVNLMLRNRHLFEGKLRKPVFDFNTSIPAFREQCEKGAARFGKLPANVSVQKHAIDGINAEMLVPSGSGPEKVLMYVHGGGYVSGSCSDHRGIVAKLAVKTGVACLLFDYRLAPEHPFPAALDDSVSVYRWLLSSGYKPEDILIAGESAGGGLCLATLLALKRKNLPLPVAAVAISPWTDLTCSGESYKTKNKVSLAPMDSWSVFSHYYSAGSDPSDPLISPLFGDLSGLPPMLITAGDADELYCDGEQFARKAKDAGCDVVFRQGEDMVHCYPLLDPMFKEAAEAMNEIVDYIQKYLKV